MNYISLDFSWTSTTTQIVVPILCTLVFFVIYWFTAQSEKVKNYFYTKHGEDKGSFHHIFFTKVVGFVAMGILPTLVCLIAIPSIPFSAYGLTIVPETTVYTLVWTLGLSALVIPLAMFSAKKPKNLINYPQIRTKEWNSTIYRNNLLGWALYLFGYEFLFRGILLIPLVEPLGLWPAIAINIALYSATHIPKGLDETIGAIPLGLVLCILTLQTQTIWIAFIVHVAMAWTNSLTALKHHPEIHYKRK